MRAVPIMSFICYTCLYNVVLLECFIEAEIVVVSYSMYCSMYCSIQFSSVAPTYIYNVIIALDTLSCKAFLIYSSSISI